MIDKVAAQKHASTAKMEAVPGFYAIYSHVFLRIMRKADLWESTQKRTPDSFDVTIKKCLWHTACAENGCAELCRLFCDSDNVTYGGLKKIRLCPHENPGLRQRLLRFSFFQEILRGAEKGRGDSSSGFFVGSGRETEGSRRDGVSLYLIVALAIAGIAMLAGCACF